MLSTVQPEQAEGLHQFLCHKVAHFWTRSPGSFSPDHWMSEAFAKYSAAMAVRERFGQHIFEQLRSRWEQGGRAHGPVWTPDGTCCRRCRSFVVRVFALDGTPLGALRTADGNLRTTPADIARFKRLDTLGQPPARRAQLVREWDLVEFPATLPAYDQLLVDARDHLWVRRFPRSILCVAKVTPTNLQSLPRVDSCTARTWEPVNVVVAVTPFTITRSPHARLSGGRVRAGRPHGHRIIRSGRANDGWHNDLRAQVWAARRRA